MARRYRRQKFKFKLKKNTVYSISSFSLILVGLLLLLSFSRSGTSFVRINDILDQYFGVLSFLFPISLILFGFFFLRMKIFLSKPNVAIGFLLFFVSLLSVTKSGLLGSYIFQFLADVLSSTGAYLVYVAGIVIGLIVLFDTSVDEIFAILAGIKDTISRLIPSGAFSFLKTKKKKSLTIKGMNNHPSYSKTSLTFNATRLWQMIWHWQRKRQPAK